MTRLTSFAALLCIVLGGCASPKVASPSNVNSEQPAIGAKTGFNVSVARTEVLKYVGYPDEGALLGQGWDSFRRSPANSVCVDFTEASVAGHDIDIKFDEVYSRSQLNKAMTLSISGGYSGFGASVNGKASFSNSLEVDRSNTNILATIQVWKGDSYTGPSLLTAAKLREGGSLSFKGLGLSNTALQVLKSLGFREFTRLCGDSFVYHIRRGAKLNAYMTFSDLSTEAKKSMSASLSASGWGASVGADTSTSEAQKELNRLTSIRIFQSGGPIRPAPIDVKEFQNTVRNFLSTNDPDLFPTKAFEVGVARYDSLHNWPSKEALANPEEMEQLISLYWLYNDLRRQYSNAVLNSDLYLMYQPEYWEKDKQIVVFIGDTLCKYGYAANKWAAIDPNMSTSCPDDAIYDNPWVLKNVLARAEALKQTAFFLRSVIDKGCDSGQCSSFDAVTAARVKLARAYDKNLTDAQVLASGLTPSDGWLETATYMSQFPTQLQREELTSRLSVLESTNKALIAEAKASGQVAAIALSVAKVTSEVNSALVADNVYQASGTDQENKGTRKTTDTTKTMVGAVANPKKGAGTPPPIGGQAFAKALSTEKSTKELMLGFKALSINKFLADKGDIDSTGQLASYLFGAKRNASSADFLRGLVDAYYEFSVQSPVRIRSRSGAEVRQEYKTGYQAAPASIDADAERLRSVIRAERALEGMRFSESHCAENVASELCRSVSWVRELLDRKETSPMLSIGSRNRTEIVGYDEKCEERWFPREFVIWEKICRKEAVMRSVTDYITEFADTTLRL